MRRFARTTAAPEHLRALGRRRDDRQPGNTIQLGLDKALRVIEVRNEASEENPVLVVEPIRARWATNPPT
jgi:hypothetical protein